MDQARISSKLNQITDITQASGTPWATPSYDQSGNMTTMPQPLALTAGYTATYDAWNRLVSLTDGTNTVATLAYDGMNRCTIKNTYTDGSLSETRHYYYSSQWRVLEERVGTSTSPDCQYVWGGRYVDDLILRDRPALPERLYAMQDANWNVVAICDNTAIVQERYFYTPYGVAVFLTPDFEIVDSSSFDWTYLFTGRPLDLNTGLQDNRNRYLHPPLGCWITQDPIGFQGDPSNLYRYVGNSPTTHTDPAGLEDYDVTKSIYQDASLFYGRLMKPGDHLLNTNVGKVTVISSNISGVYSHDKYFLLGHACLSNLASHYLMRGTVFIGHKLTVPMMGIRRFGKGHISTNMHTHLLIQT